MAFDFDETNPLDGALISGYPTNERAARAAVLGSFTNDHDEATGDHDKVGLVQGNDDDSDEPALDGTLGFLYGQDIGGETELHYKSDAGQVVIISTNGVIAPLAVLKAGDAMSGVLALETGSGLQMDNDIRIRGETAAAASRDLAFVDTSDNSVFGNKSEQMFLRAFTKDQFIAVYPGGPDNEPFMHKGNDGTGSGFDADLLDGIEAEDIFSSLTTGRFFESAAQAATAGASAGAIAHGLGSVPRLVTAALRVKSGQSDQGYSSLQELNVASDTRPDASVGLTIGGDLTNVFYVVGVTGLQILNQSTRVESNLDESKWEILIRAWK